MNASDSETEKPPLRGLNIAPPVRTWLRVRVREFILETKPKPCLSQQTRWKIQYIVFFVTNSGIGQIKQQKRPQLVFFVRYGRFYGFFCL